MILQRFMKSFLFDRDIIRLAKQLDEICEKLNDRYNINAGGCCYTAYCIAKMLEKADLNFYLTVFDRDCNISDLSRACNHYAIRIKTIFNSYIINVGSFGNVAYRKDFKVSSSDILEHYINNSLNDFYNIKNNIEVKTSIEQVYERFAKNLYKK